MQDRRARLGKLEKWILDNRSHIIEAIYSDFRKPPAETESQEIFLVLKEIRHARRHLKKWMKRHPARRTLPLLTVRSWIEYVPKGIVLIISPWNFPFLLTAGPLISALAAGNCVIVKPSEFAPSTARLVRKMVKDLFPEQEVAVVCGSKEAASELLKYPFDHIFFTGSSEVGKKVMYAAAQNLCPVTLELGGKSPAVVDETANLKDAAQKIVWGKFFNAGQTCIAPDYVLAHEKIFLQLVDLMKNEIVNFYGKDQQEQMSSNDFARIIDRRHFNRLKDLLRDALNKNAHLETGSIPANSEKFIPPTILTDVNENMKIMQEEIFGPILPVIDYQTLEEAIDMINRQSIPLAVYVFSGSKNSVKKVFLHTRSGSGAINEVVVQFIHPELPFGGRGKSGFGSSHGFYGFKTFSHEKSFVSGNRWTPVKLLYPPYSKFKKKMINTLIKFF
ncbi:MAG: aldehyde dehydrogenase family protein [Calditrichaeota bacterium]|nr:aldehyde dehydrogenase family protein [Calditrichota bacterium]